MRRRAFAEVLKTARTTSVAEICGANVPAGGRALQRLQSTVYEREGSSRRSEIEEVGFVAQGVIGKTV